MSAGTDVAMPALDSTLERNRIYLGDCLRVMQEIAPASVDMILCDLPYGTTACKWDTVIPFAPLWAQYRRIIKPRGAIVLTASQPFTSALVMSAPDLFRYAWVWTKTQAVGHLNAWRQPMRQHEDVCVFAVGAPLYFPIIEDKPIKDRRPQTARTKLTNCYGAHDLNTHRCPADKSMPRSVLSFANVQRGVHPTQKPVALFEYLIKTYTKGGDLVLDNCAGSGTAAIACINTARDYILIEQSEAYVKSTETRIATHITKKETP